MKGLWGKKIGMTQIFLQDKAVPVTVIDMSNWYVTHTRTVARDGYNAVQIGCVRPRYGEQSFVIDWIKKPKQYFSFIREIKLDKDPSEMDLMVGKPADFLATMQAGDKVDVFGTSKGKGFAGVVKRHGFNGSPASHGAKMGKRPGSLSWTRAEGRVPKGKRLPGRLGNVQKVIRNLEVMTIKLDNYVLLLKGSVPGRAGSLVFLRKA